MDDGVVLAISFSYMAFIRLRKFYYSFLSFFFNDNKVLDFVKYFSVSIQVVMFFFPLPSNTVVYYID